MAFDQFRAYEPGALALPGLVVALAVLGFGGLYAVLRIRDWIR